MLKKLNMLHVNRTSLGTGSFTNKRFLLKTKLKTLTRQCIFFKLPFSNGLSKVIYKSIVFFVNLYWRRDVFQSESCLLTSRQYTNDALVNKVNWKKSNLNQH